MPTDMHGPRRITGADNEDHVVFRNLPKGYNEAYLMKYWISCDASVPQASSRASFARRPSRLPIGLKLARLSSLRCPRDPRLAYENNNSPYLPLGVLCKQLFLELSTKQHGGTMRRCTEWVSLMSYKVLSFFKVAITWLFLAHHHQNNI